MGSGCDVTMLEMSANGNEGRKTLLETYSNGKGWVKPYLYLITNLNFVND